MRHIDDIDEPTWHDLFDREDRIKKLEGEVSTLSKGMNPTEVMKDLEVPPLPESVVAGLDPGIADLVVVLRMQGFETTDSGDGESKNPEHMELDYPHVMMVIPSTNIVGESKRLQDWVDADRKLQNWTVEASYSPKDDVALLSLCLFNQKEETG